MKKNIACDIVLSYPCFNKYISICLSVVWLIVGQQISASLHLMCVFIQPFNAEKQITIHESFPLDWTLK